MITFLLGRKWKCNNLGNCGTATSIAFSHLGPAYAYMCGSSCLHVWRKRSVSYVVVTVITNIQPNKVDPIGNLFLPPTTTPPATPTSPPIIIIIINGSYQYCIRPSYKYESSVEIDFYPQWISMSFIWNHWQIYKRFDISHSKSKYWTLCLNTESVSFVKLVVSAFGFPPFIEACLFICCDEHWALQPKPRQIWCQQSTKIPIPTATTTTRIKKRTVNIDSSIELLSTSVLDHVVAWEVERETSQSYWRTNPL